MINATVLEELETLRTGLDRLASSFEELAFTPGVIVTKDDEALDTKISYEILKATATVGNLIRHISGESRIANE